MPQNPWAVVQTKPLAPDDPWAVVSSQPSANAQGAQGQTGIQRPVVTGLWSLGKRLAYDAVDLVKNPGANAAQAVGDTTRMVSRLASDVASPILHPIDTMISLGRAPLDMFNAQGAEWDKAKEAYAKGDKGKASMHALAYLMPVVGPMLDSFAERIANGEGPEVAADVTSMFAGPKILSGVAKMMPRKILPSMRSMPAQDAQAVDWAQQQGIPLSAGTMTGSPVIRGTEQGAQKTSLIGGKIGSDAAQATRQEFATVGEGMAASANSGGTAHTFETAGADAARRAQSSVASFAKEADDAYSAIRQAEQNNSVIGVDLKASRQSLESLHKELSAQRDAIGGLPPGAKANALVALDKLMRVKDASAPLTVVDSALSELKAILRDASAGANVDSGTGALAKIVKELDTQVVNAAKSSAPGIYDKLMEGRTATINKYNAADVLDVLQGSDGSKVSRVAQQLMAPKDANMAQLRTIAAEVPEAMPHIGRAYLEDMMARMTADPGELKNMLAEWQKLGMGTKRTVFAEALKKNPSYLTDLDNFFLAAKRAGANANTSGTAAQAANIGKLTMLTGVGFINPTVWLFAGLQELGAAGMAKALQSPTVVRALTRGINLPSMAPAAVKAGAVASINTALKAQGLPELSFASNREKEKE